MRVPSGLLRRSNLMLVLISATTFSLSNIFNACSKVGFQSPSSSQNLLGSQSGPQILINNGALYTKDVAVNLGLQSTGSTEMYITNEPGCGSGGSWAPFMASEGWTLGATNQATAVYGKFRNADLVETVCVNASIVHDDIAPVIVVDSSAPSLTNINMVSAGFHATDSGSGVDQLLCILPGQQSSVPCAGAFAASNIVDGGYLVQFLATDKAGNTSAPVQQNFIVDTTPPKVIVNSGPALVTASSSATFDFIAVDRLSGVKSFACKLDTQSAFSDCMTGQSYGGLAQGPHIFYVHATDNAGNISADATYNWEINTSAPTIEFTQTPGPVTDSAQATFAFDGHDDQGRAITQFLCQLNGAGLAPCTSPTLLSGLTQGGNTFGVVGVNSLGVQSAELTYSWLVDLTPPTIQITQGPQMLTNINNATFTFTVGDTLSGISTITCSLDGGAAQNCAALSQTYSNLGGNMQHSFQISATDVAGNSAVSAPFNWYIDNTPPVLTIVSQPSALSSSPDAQFQISATDLSGPITYMCRLDSAATFTPCTTTNSYAALADGSHTFYAQAQDAAGNLSAIQSYTWTIETVGPRVTFTQTPGATLVDTSHGTVAYTITDSLSTVISAVCKVDVTNLTPCSTSGSTLTLPLLTDGSHTVSVTATNAAGVTSSVTYTFNVVAPTIITYAPVGSVAAVAFEDLYGVGNPDYDYNDFLTEFQVTEKVNSGRQVTDIYLDFYPRAIGAGYDHSFILALSGTVTTPGANNSGLPVTKPLFKGAANIDVTYYDSNGKVISQQASQTYDNQDVVVFSSTHGAFGQAAAAGSINSALPTNYSGTGVPSNYIKATQNARVHLALGSPSSNPVPSSGQFDVSTLRMVLHVKSTNENIDIIDVAPNNFTSSGNPWGFIIPTDWQWMQETVSINSGYPNFAAYQKYLIGQNTSCPSTPTCINWFKYPASGAAAASSLYPSIPFAPILPTP